MMADGRGWLYSPAGPARRPAADALRAARVAGRRTCSTRSVGCNPAALRWNRPDNPTPRRGRPALPARRDDVPAHRAPHGRRDEPQPALARRAAARDVRRDRPGARRRARDRGRRLDDDRDRSAPRSRRARGSPSACGRCGSTGRDVHQVALPWHWGYGGASPGRQRRTTSSRCRGDPNVVDPGVQGVHLQRARRAAARGETTAQARAACTPPSQRRARAATPPAEDTAHVMTEIADPAPGRRADGLLHRHDGVHRLQGVRGRLQAVERPARRRRRVPQGRLLRPHGRAAAQHLAPRALRRARRRRRRRAERRDPRPASATAAADGRADRRRGGGRRRSTTGSSCPTSASTARTPAASTRARPAR